MYMYDVLPNSIFSIGQSYFGLEQLLHLEIYFFYEADEI